MSEGLQTQPFEVPLASGVQEGVDRRALAPGGFLRLENLQYDQAGALRKRLGYGALPTTRLHASTGAALPPIHRLDTLGEQLLGIGLDPDTSRQTLYSLTPAYDEWTPVDDAGPCSVSRAPLIRDRQGDASPHVSRAAGQLVTTYTTPSATLGLATGLYLRAVDEDSGTVLQSERLVDASSGLVSYHAACAVGAQVVILYETAAGLYLRRYDPTSNTVSGPILVFGTPPITYFDISAIDAVTFALAYRGSATAVSVEQWVLSSAVVQHLQLVTASIGSVAGPVSVRADSTRVLVTTQDESTSTDYQISSFAASTLAPQWGPTVYHTDTGGASAGRPITVPNGDIWIVWSEFGPTLLGVQRCNGSTGAPIGGSRQIYGLNLWTRPFLRNGLAYVVAKDGVILCLSDTTDTAKPLTVAGFISTSGQRVELVGSVAPSPVVTQVGTLDTFPVLVAVDPTAGASEGSGVDLVTLDWSPSQSALWGAAQAQQSIAHTGALTSWCDGQIVVEQGFARGPVITGAVVTGADGGISGTGSAPGDSAYLYVCCYEWYDSAGNLHRSAPSDPFVVKVDAAHDLASITLTISTLAYTRRGDRGAGDKRDVTIAIYRTRANESANIFRLFAHMSRKAPVNNRAVNSVTYVDRAADATILALGFGAWTADAGGLLYFEGGVIPPDFPPPSSAICLHQRRLWLASAEDSKALWFTRELALGEAPAWAASFFLRLDDSPGGIVALASLDDYLVIFTERSIYYAAGPGPTDGGMGAYPEIRRVNASAGCVDARSVVSYEGGVFFQSAAGLMRLDRALQLSFAGNAVQTTVGPTARIIGSALDGAGKRIFWIVQPPAGVAYLVEHNYNYSSWYTHKPADGLNQYSVTMRGPALVIGGGDNVAQEGYGGTPYLDGDAGSWPASVVAFPWVKPSGIDGWQRTKQIVITADWLGPHVLTVSVYRDYDDSAPVQVQTFDATNAGDLAGLPVMRLTMRLRSDVQKGSALRVVISDGPGGFVSGGSGHTLPAETGAGFSLAGLSLHLGIKRGVPKLNASNRK